MTCKYLKLLNGEGIIATIQNSEDWYNQQFVQAINPLILASIKVPKLGYVVEKFMFLPWMSITDEATVTIPVRNIVAIVDVRKEIQEKYEFYINESEEEITEEQEISDNEMDDVLDSTMEQLFNLINEDNDTEEEENGKSDRRIIH